MNTDHALHSTAWPAHGKGLSKPIKLTYQALTLVNPFHKRHHFIILTLQYMILVLSDQIIDLYNFPDPIEWNLCIYDEKNKCGLSLIQNKIKSYPVGHAWLTSISHNPDTS